MRTNEACSTGYEHAHNGYFYSSANSSIIVDGPASLEAMTTGNRMRSAMACIVACAEPCSSLAAGTTLVASGLSCPRVPPRSQGQLPPTAADRRSPAVRPARRPERRKAPRRSSGSGAAPMPPWPARRSSGGDGRPVARPSAAVSQRRRPASWLAGRAGSCAASARAGWRNGTPSSADTAASPARATPARSARSVLSCSLISSQLRLTSSAPETVTSPNTCGCRRAGAAGQSPASAATPQPRPRQAAQRRGRQPAGTRSPRRRVQATGDGQGARARCRRTAAPPRPPS
jgi:hypothetical protein